MTELTCPECGPKWSGAYTCEHRCGVCRRVLRGYEEKKTPEAEIRGLHAKIDQLTQRAQKAEDELASLRQAYDVMRANYLRYKMLAETRKIKLASTKTISDRWKSKAEDWKHEWHEIKTICDAQAAHVEGLRSQMDQVMPSKDMSADLGEIYKLYDEFEATPKTNLAQRDARMKADALEELQEELVRAVENLPRNTQEMLFVHVGARLSRAKYEYRQQARGRVGNE